MGWVFRQAAEREGKPKEVPSMTLVKWLLGQLATLKTSSFILVSVAALSIAVNTVSPYVVKILVDEGIVGRNVDAIVKYTLILVAVSLVGWALSFIRTQLTGRLNQWLLSHLRSSSFRHLEDMDVGYMSGERTGKMISLISNDIQTIGDVATEGAVEVLVSSLTVIGALYAMLTLHIWLSLATFSIIPMMILLSRYLAKRARMAYRETREKVSELTSNTEQAVSGSRESQAFVQRRDVDERQFDKISKETMKVNVRARVIFSLVQPSLDTLRALSFVIMIPYGGSLVASGQLSVGALIAFYGYADMFFRPIVSLTAYYNVVQSALAAAERAFIFEGTKPEITEVQGARDINIERGMIELESVDFSYRETKVLDGINLIVEAGEILAIVGPTGAGKTTITNLVMRLYDLKTGKVLIDGHDIKEFTFKSLRGQVALVPQDPILFNDTVLENVRIGRPEAKDEEVERIISDLGLEGLIAGLSDGYKTIITPGGSNLSVGQRQLISFARAMLKDPKILILDEATSSLDPHTEALLQDAMVELMRGRTCLLIAHRLSTVSLAHRIIVLEGGMIVEEGTHRELMTKGGAYAKLYELQFGTVPVVARTDP